MHIGLIFKEQEIIKRLSLREIDLAQPHDSLKLIVRYKLFVKRKVLLSSIIEKNEKV
jgi:hypothetical protein